jgi:DNA polymerase-4
MAKLATSAAKPGFVEVPPDCEREFLAERHVGELAGVGRRRERSLLVLGARTFGDVARLPSTVLKQKFGIWGQQLWLFANGQWNEPLLLEVKDRTTISSSTTLPYDEPDYEAARIFALSESTRLIGQLRREGLQAREMSLAIRFTDFTENGAVHRFDHPQFRNSIVNGVLQQLFDETMVGNTQPVRQIRICFNDLKSLDMQPTLWGTTDAERWGALDSAMQQLEGQWGDGSVLTGAQYALRHQDAAYANPKSKCPFVPAREMAQKLWGEKLEHLSHHHHSN